MKKRAAIWSVLAGLAYSGVAYAAPCSTTPVPYSTWLATGFSCTVGNELFSNFGYSATGTAGPASGVNVFALPAAGNNGLEFTSAGWTSTGGQRGDAAINFLVSTTAPIIGGTSLTIAGSVIGTGFATVGETLNPSGDPAVTLTTSLPSNPSDHVTFAPTTSVLVLKDILTMSLDCLDSISAIQQRFSQVGDPVPVPEPASMALLGLGMAGLGMVRRLRKK